MRRPGYRETVEWIARNDDCYWLGDYDGHGSIMSVTASMVRDLYDVEDDKLLADLRRALKKVHPDHVALREPTAVNPAAFQTPFGELAFPRVKDRT